VRTNVELRHSVGWSPDLRRPQHLGLHLDRLSRPRTMSCVAHSSRRSPKWVNNYSWRSRVALKWCCNGSPTAAMATRYVTRSGSRRSSVESPLPTSPTESWPPAPARTQSPIPSLDHASRYLDESQQCRSAEREPTRSFRPRPLGGSQFRRASAAPNQYARSTVDTPRTPLVKASSQPVRCIESSGLSGKSPRHFRPRFQRETGVDVWAAWVGQTSSKCTCPALLVERVAWKATHFTMCDKSARRARATRSIPRFDQHSLPFRPALLF
jgi:hypothetical protein